MSLCSAAIQVQRSHRSLAVESWDRRSSRILESASLTAAAKFYERLLGEEFGRSVPDVIIQALNWHYNYVITQFKNLPSLSKVDLDSQNGKVNYYDFKERVFTSLLALSIELGKSGLCYQDGLVDVSSFVGARDAFNWLAQSDQPKAIILAIQCLTFNPSQIYNIRNSSSQSEARPKRYLKLSRQSLVVPYVSYYTLHVVFKVRIDWTDNLSRHLEFNRETRVLSIFRYPSLCVLMIRGTMAQALAPFLSGETQVLQPSNGFVREVLRSYRLIFGQTLSQNMYRCSTDVQALKESATHDKLLDILCGNEETKVAKVLDIGGETVGYYADTTEGFPYLASRLSALQTFSQHQNPSSLSALWRDRRDLTRWYTFWAVFCIGFVSILLGLLQTVLATMQVWLVISIQNDMMGQAIPGRRQCNAEEPELNPKVFRFAAHLGLFLNRLLPISANSWFLLPIVTVILVLSVSILQVQSPPAIFGLRRNKLPPGSSSVNWTCNCGASLHDDFIELTGGAAQHYEETLQSLCTQGVDGHHDIESNLPSRAKDLEAKKPASTQLSWYQTTFFGLFPHRVHRRVTKCKNLQALESSQDLSSDPVYLLVCIDNGRRGTTLQQIDIRSCYSDGDLFRLLRHNRLKLLGRWRPLLSFRTLRTIKFVQFELFSSGDVDIRPHDDVRMLPPEDRANEYSYSPCPPELLPPLGEQRLLHLWEYSDHPDHVFSICMTRFPKRLRERLHVESSGSCIGWGIRLVEGFHWRLIWLVLFIIFGIGGLVFAIVFAALKNDVQSAFTVSTYFISMATLFVAVCSLRWR